MIKALILLVFILQTTVNGQGIIPGIDLGTGLGNLLEDLLGPPTTTSPDPPVINSPQTTINRPPKPEVLPNFASPTPLPAIIPPPSPKPVPIITPNPAIQQPVVANPIPTPTSPPPIPEIVPPSPQTPSPTPQTLTPSPQQPVEPVAVVLPTPSPPTIKAKPRPPPPAKKSTKSSGGISTTTIIIIVAASVGGLIIIAVVIAICCACRRKNKGKENAAKQQQHDAMMMMHGSPSKEMAMMEQGSQQYIIGPDGQYYRPSPSKKPTIAAHQIQSVPLSMLEPEDLPRSSGSASSYHQQQTMPTLAGSGPLGAAMSSAPLGSSGNVIAARGSGAGAATQMTQSVSAHGPAHQSQRSSETTEISQRPGGTLPMAPASSSEYNDALLTWIGGQLSQDDTTKKQQQQQQQGLQRSHTKQSPSRSKLVDFSAFEIDFTALRVGRRIGEGSFGKVYLANWNETPVAVKVLVDESTALDHHPGALRDFATPVLSKLQEEAGLMASLRHPNVVSFLGFCQMPPCVITEYCSRGSLSDVLRAAKQGKSEGLSWQRRLSMAADAATGMLHLHARNPPIIHRDLKSANLLVDAHWRLKVADFNLSRIVEESTGSSSLAAMNPRWLAPELMSGEGATSSSDVFSFGVVLWEILTWDLPWLKDNPWSIVHIVGNGGRLQIPSRWDLPGDDTTQFGGLDDYISLMQRCWAQNVYDRPSFSEIVQELRSLEARAPNSTAMTTNQRVDTGFLLPTTTTNARSQHRPSSADFESERHSASIGHQYEESDSYYYQSNDDEHAANASISSMAAANASMNDPKYASKNSGAWGSG